MKSSVRLLVSLFGMYRAARDRIISKEFIKDLNEIQSKPRVLPNRSSDMWKYAQQYDVHYKTMTTTTTSTTMPDGWTNPITTGTSWSQYPYGKIYGKI